MARRLLLLTLGSALCVGLPAQALAQRPTDEIVDNVVKSALKDWHVPGAAVVVVSGDKVEFLKGYGLRRLDRDEIVTADTVFPLASCTKAFTATALAILVDDGKLGWDDLVRKHLENFHLADPDADRMVTLRDILCHRTGVGGHDFLWYRAPWNQDESIRRIGKIAAEGPFRSTFEYQSIMYMAAGKIAGIHHAGGWAGLVKERILDPLGMTATTLTGTEAAKFADRASGHRRNDAGKLEMTPEYPMTEPNAAGSIHTSARDLARWLSFQLGDGACHGKRLLSPAAFAEPHKPHTIIPMVAAAKAMNPYTVQLSYAMGWIVQDYRGERMLSHSGWIDGFRVHLTLLPERKLGLAVLANVHGTRMNLAVCNRLVDLFLGSPEKNWNAHFAELVQNEDKAKAVARIERDKWRNPTHPLSLPLKDYVGEYEHPAYGTCSITLANGRLTWEWSSFKKVLEPFRGDVFEIRESILSDPLLAFQGTRAGVTGLSVLGVEFAKKK